MEIQVKELLKKELLSDESEEMNRQSLASILPYFRLDQHMYERRVLAEFEDSPYKAGVFGLNKGNKFRRIFEVAYQSDALYNSIWNIFRHSFSSGEFLDKCMPLTREAFRTGVVDKQKIMRFIKARIRYASMRGGVVPNDYIMAHIDRELLDKDRYAALGDAMFKTIDEIYGKRMSETVLFMVSLNPIDKLFCSTGHGFTSCHALTSTYNGAFYMGLPMTIVSDCTLYCAVITGKVFTSNVGRYEFKIPKVLNRSLVYTGRLIGPNGETRTNKRYFNVARIYPNECTDQISIFTGVMERVFGMINIDDGSDKCSMFISKPIAPLYYENKEMVVPYVDGATYGDVKAGNDGTSFRHRYYHRIFNGVPKDSIDNSKFRFDYYSPVEMNWQGGFVKLVVDDINIFDYKEENFEYTCESCERGLDGDDVYWAFEEPYCERCFNRRFFYCTKCGDVERNDDGISVDGNLYCERCAERIGMRCDRCGDWMFKDDAHMVYKNPPDEFGLYDEGDASAFCEDCICGSTCMKEYFYCAHESAYINIRHSDLRIKACECPGHFDGDRSTMAYGCRGCKFRLTAVAKHRSMALVHIA